MAKVSPINSDGESRTRSPPKGSKSKIVEEVDAMEVDDENKGEDESGEEGGNEEEEYEIEAILDAKRGAFPEGRMGYLVKWKGYDEGENSWVDERDAGNAEVLIEEYWRKHPKKARKSETKTPKRPRKSEEAPDISAKKRGRQSQVGAKGDHTSAATKISKKTRKNGAPVSETEEEPQNVEEVVLTDMAKYMSVSSWEHLVNSIDTIEREIDGSLHVYFTLTSGERIKENSTICAERFPQKLISFYESNLRWRSAEPDE